MKASRWFRLALLPMAALLVTCNDPSGNGNRPTRGWLTLRLTSPNADDGGVLITVSGATIDSVRTTQSNLVTRRESASSIRVIIGGNLTSGMIGEILVPDTRQVSQYTALIQEVAARTTYQQRPLAGYSVSVVAPPR